MIDSTLILEKFQFDNSGVRELSCHTDFCHDWPVVYIIYNEADNGTTIYVGETNDVYNRMNQHLRDKGKADLKMLLVIHNTQFNKSAILDVEQYLIRLFGSEKDTVLKNNNSGQSPGHNYYQRDKYRLMMPEIWKELMRFNLAKTDYKILENSELFKYSPYTALTVEQMDISNEIIHDIIETLGPNGNRGLSLVRGCAGTGKTVMAMSLLLTLADFPNRSDDSNIHHESTDDQLNVQSLKKMAPRGLKVALVVPMESLRKTLKTIAKKINGLNENMIIKPSEVVDMADDPYDVLIVDESHRLSIRKILFDYHTFDTVSRKFSLDPYRCSSLDWIMMASKHQVLFYDDSQTVRPSDIPDNQFQSTIGNPDVRKMEYELKSQMRCQGGTAYIDYVRRILNCEQKVKMEVRDYSFRLFDDPNEMIREIKERNEEYGLCRIVAGYGWEWKSKGKKIDEIQRDDLYDIRFGDEKYVWNMNGKGGWVNREKSIDEIGCIHTIQGFDVNYIGVIFGPEIDYDESTGILIDRSKFYDRNTKNGSDDDTVKKHIVNAYGVMMTRGIRGCYIYAVNKNLQNYLRIFTE